MWVLHDLVISSLVSNKLVKILFMEMKKARVKLKGALEHFLCAYNATLLLFLIKKCALLLEVDL